MAVRVTGPGRDENGDTVLDGTVTVHTEADGFTLQDRHLIITKGDQPIGVHAGGTWTSAAITNH